MDITAFIISIGNIQYKEDSKEILADYFKFHKINFFFLDNNPEENFKKAHPSWLKLISHKIYPTDDFLLCWDLDLLPINRTRNIILDLDLDKLNMCYDSSVLLGAPKFTTNFKYNGGLCGIPKKYRNFAENVYLSHAPGIWPSFEQYYLNEEIEKQKIEMKILDPIWNSHYPALGYSNVYFEKTFNKHYTWGINDSQKPREILKHKINYFSSLE